MQVQSFVHVFLRENRPLSDKETQEGDQRCVTITPSTGEVSVVRQNRQQTNTFTFDRAYDSGSTQKEIYTDLVAPIVDEVLKGFNCTVFAYGWHSKLGIKTNGKHRTNWHW